MSDTRGSDQTVVLTGGVRTPSDALVGPLAVAALQNIHLDLVFMGVHGMDVRAGFTSPTARRLIVVDVASPSDNQVMTASSSGRS